MAFARTFYIDNINRTDVMPYIGTARQLVRTIPVAGSTRTAGAITVEHETSALGDLLIYFWPNTVSGYSPPLRQYRSGGGTVTTDAATVSGGTESIFSSVATFDVPVAQLSAGAHLLMVRVLTSTAVDITYTAQTRIGSTDVGAAPSVTANDIDTSSAYEIRALGALILPPVGLPDTSPAVVRLTLSASAACTLDEAWLFNTEIGQLVKLSCGSASPAAGGSANRVFIEPATANRPRPTIRIGHAADGSDSFHPPTLDSWQFPQLTPPDGNVLTVATNALNVSTTLRHRPSWHTHAAL